MVGNFLVRDGSELTACLREGRAWAESPEEEQPARGPVVEVLLMRHQCLLHGDRQPQVVRDANDLTLEPRSSDTNDDHRYVVDEHLLADGVAVAREATDPVIMADHHDW